MAQMGRPRSFDRDQAVEQALLLFWEHGYDATSLNQLKAGIGGGITAPSFYAAFGSKEALFHEAVERYMSSYGRVNDPLFEEDMGPREALETSLRQSAAMQCAAGHPKGCMVALGTMSGCVPASAEVAAPLTRARARTRAGIRFCIERGVAYGELEENTDIDGLAATFESFMLGISPMARDGVALEVIERAIECVMRLWPR